MLENKLSRVVGGWGRGWVAGLAENKTKPSSLGLAELGNITDFINNISILIISNPTSNLSSYPTCHQTFHPTSPVTNFPHLSKTYHPTFHLNIQQTIPFFKPSINPVFHLISLDLTLPKTLTHPFIQHFSQSGTKYFNQPLSKPFAQPLNLSLTQPLT
jgi:hypothetical protein